MQGTEGPGPPANEGEQDEIGDEELLQMAFADYEPQQQVSVPFCDMVVAVTPFCDFMGHS